MITKNLNCYIAVVLLLGTVLNLKGQTSTDAFFGDTFKNDKRNGDFIVEWYSKFLTAMEEPSLYNLSQDQRIHCYRFLWLRTFHHPISLRLSIDPEGTGLITVKIADGAGGYEPGKIITNENVPVSKRDVDTFLKVLREANFWQLPAVEKSDRMGLDGAQWVIEGTKSGKYHVADRWSPEKGSFRKLGLLMVQLSKLKIENVY